MVHVLALTLELRIPSARSLKAKRSVIRPVVDRLRARHAVAVAETGHQDSWQRCQLGLVAVAGDARSAEELVDKAERVVWAVPDLEVIEARRDWMELD